MRGSKIIITILVFLLFFLFATALMASNSEPKNPPIDYLDKILGLIKEIVATGGVLGLWIRYEINKRTNKKKETVNHNELILKIAESDKKQSESIEDISFRLLKIEESKESENASLNIKFEIDQVAFEGLKSVKATSFTEVATYAVGKLSAIFANILLVDFKTPLASLKTQLDIVINQTMNFEIKNAILSDEDSHELKRELTHKLEKLNSRLMLDLQTVFKKTNGVRRSAFSELIKEYIKNAVFESTELFKSKLK